MISGTIKPVAEGHISQESKGIDGERTSSLDCIPDTIQDNVPHVRQRTLRRLAFEDQAGDPGLGFAQIRQRTSIKWPIDVR